MTRAKCEIRPDQYFSCFVPGIAKTSGSKRAFQNKATGKMIVTADNPKQKTWQQAVKWVAMEKFMRQCPFEGPLALDMVFVKGYPGWLKRSGKYSDQLQDWAHLCEPATKPDGLKLGRAGEDALSGIVYNDDAQIVEHHIRKAFGPRPGVHIVVRSFVQDNPKAPKGQ